MVLTRIKTDNILDRQVFQNDLADGAVTFAKIAGLSGGLPGHVLATDGFGSLLWTTAAGAPLALDSLTDVDVTTDLPAIGDSLAWNGTNWVPQTSISGNPGNVSLNNLTDTTITTPLVQNQFLRYNGFGQWVNSKISIVYVDGRADVAVTGLLNSLVDVNVTGATSGQRLGFDGSQWRAVDAATLDSIDLFLDVDTTSVAPVGGDALVWNGGSNQWEPLSVGLGASSNTYVVANIIARDALSAAEGDQAFVRTGTSGEYELYIWDAAWILVGTADSARTDANTIDTGLPSHPHGNILFGDTTPVTIGNISNNSRVTTVTVEVIIPFDGDITNLPPTFMAPAFFSIGDDGNNSRLFIDNDTTGTVDWLVAGSYVCTVDYTYNGTEVAGTADTDVKAYFNFTGSTTGEARIIVTHV